MKQLTVIIALFFLTQPLLAEPQTLFGDELDVGGFGGPAIKATIMNGDGALLVGGRGGAIINSSFTIGGGGYGLTNKIELGHVNSWGQDLSLQMGYGGLEIGFVHNSDDLYHYTYYCLVGGGGISVGYKYDDIVYGSHSSWRSVKSDEFFVVEPTASIELNVTRIFRIEFGASYRYADGLDNSYITDDEISGLSGTVTFKFGAYSNLFGMFD